MNLVMYRMQDTERVRFKLREDRRQEVRMKAEREEEREKLQMERLERNKKWRERKLGIENLKDMTKEKPLDEREERIQKNKDWRIRRQNGGTIDERSEREQRQGEKSLVSSLVLPELHCQNCHELLMPPGRIFQCEDDHKICQTCASRQDKKVRFRFKWDN